MIKRLEDVPAGTIGFEFGGEVTGEEYRGVLEPPLEEAVAAGEVRLLRQTAADFDGMKLGAEMKIFATAESADARTWVAAP
jgi:hypothetical protein